MKKVGIVLGAAAVAVFAGCKDPSYRSYSSTSQDESKVAGETAATEEVKATEPEPAPVEPVAEEEAPVKEAEPAPAPAPEEETTVYIVQRGDYLAKISKKYNVTLAAIHRLNPQIKADNVVRVGQKIKLPGKIDVGEQKTPAPTPVAKKTSAPVKAYTGPTKEYVVKGGDTLGGIAHAYGLKVRQLKELNGLQKDVIRVGQKLKVPTEKQVAPKKEAPKAAAAEKKSEVKPAEKKAAEKPAETAPVKTESAATATEVAPAAAEATPTEGTTTEETESTPADAEEVSYTVQEGEDLADVSIKFSVSIGEIRDLNNLGDEPLKAGQVLKLPAGAVEQR